MATVVGVQWQKAFDIILLFEIWQKCVFLRVEQWQMANNKNNTQTRVFSTIEPAARLPMTTHLTP
jgi:hypothetical protein